MADCLSAFLCVCVRARGSRAVRELRRRNRWPASGWRCHWRGRRFDAVDFGHCPDIPQGQHRRDESDGALLNA